MREQQIGAMPGKRCYKCKTVFVDPAAVFHRSGKNRDGLRGECKDCQRAGVEFYRERKRGPEASAALERHRQQRLEDLTLGGKTCRRCSVRYEDPAAAFDQSARSPDGLMSRCKSCCRVTVAEWKKSRERRWETESRTCPVCKEFYPVAASAFRGDRPACKACLRKEAKQYYHEHWSRREANAVAATDKKCSMCGVTYADARVSFNRRVASSDGLNSRCRGCDAAGKKERRQRDPERIKAQRLASARRLEASLRVKRKIAYQKNPALWKKRAKEWRDANLTRAREQARRKRRHELATNPEPLRRRARLGSLVRRAKKINAGGVCTPRDLKILYAAQRGLCFWCDKPVGDKYHIDHLIPIAKGGPSWPWNLVVSCPACNFSKHDKAALDWAPAHWKKVCKGVQLSLLTPAAGKRRKRKSAWP